MVTPLRCGLLPVPLPDENCYSLLCRYAVRRGQFSSSQICMELFGHTEPLSGYLFKPFRMRNLKRWFADRGITAWPEYGTEHSCYPFYTAFLSLADAEKVRSCGTGSVLTAGQAKRINRKCGFPKSHKKSLWYCPSCVREDIARYGETCWRRLPQLPGAIYCPVHREPFRESGIRYEDTNYRIIPATYAVIQASEPDQEYGTVYADRYVRLAGDIFWLLESKGFIPDNEWLVRTYSKTAGKQINSHLLYSISGSSLRGKRFEDYLSTRIMKDSGKERIGDVLSRQISTILSIEKAFGSIVEFLN